MLLAAVVLEIVLQNPKDSPGSRKDITRGEDHKSQCAMKRKILKIAALDTYTVGSYR